MMLAVKLELPSKPFSEILQGIRICNEKRRASQPLGQKSAGCIFKNPPGASAGRMIDELGLKGHSASATPASATAMPISSSTPAKPPRRHARADRRRARARARKLMASNSKTRWWCGTREDHRHGTRRRCGRRFLPAGAARRRRAALPAPAEAGRNSPQEIWRARAGRSTARVLVLGAVGVAGCSRDRMSAAVSCCIRRSCCCSSRIRSKLPAITSSAAKRCCNNLCATAAAACCAFRWTPAAASSKQFPGSNPPACSAFCRIAFASNSPNALRSLSCATATSLP